MRGWIIFILMAWPCLSFAQPVIVRTGEHNGFTRVVLTIPEGASWRLGRDAQGYVLEIPIREGYDLRRFFDLIPRTRITQITQQVPAGVLRLAVACPCHASAFVYRPDILVIDVKDGPPPAFSPFEQPLDSPELQVNADQTGRLPAAYMVNDLLPTIISKDATSDVDRELESDGDQTAVGPLDMRRDTNPVISLPARPDLTTMEDTITRGLGLGLTEGLLSGSSQVDQIVDSEGIQKDVRDPQALPGIALHTGVDQAAVPVVSEVDRTQSGLSCMEGRQFDVSAWGDDRPFFDQINPAHSALTGEFDLIDENAVIALARLFVYFGFGREAQQTLAMNDVQSQARVILGAMAQIIDGDPVEPNRFAGQVSCSSEVALWALLASPTNPLDATVNRSAVLRSFRALPDGLQATLGPQLSERFVAIGDHDAASQVLGPARSASFRTVDLALADIALMTALDEPVVALDSLKGIARNDAYVAPDTMIRFFRTGIQSGLAFSTSDFENADVLRFENASLPIAAGLMAAQIEAYLHMDQFEEASVLLASDPDTLEVGTLTALQDAFLLQAADRAKDADFLRLVWSDTVPITTVGAQTVVAERLLQLGFPARAREILTADVTGGDAAMRLYLLAEAALALNEPQFVLDLMAGISSERAEKLRQTAEAAQSDSVIPSGRVLDPDITARLANLRGGDDPDVETPTGRSFVNPETAVDLSGALAEDRALLDQSVQARARLQELLQQYEVPAEF